MKQYSFLATPRWIGLIILMITASIACIALGEWQYDRHEQRVAAADQIRDTWDNEPVALDTITGPEDEWQVTRLTGTFVEGSQVLLRGRSVNGVPAAHVIALFTTDRNGEPLTVIVDRGWIPQSQAEGSGDTESFVPPQPEGTITIEARMRPPEDAFDRTPADGWIYTLNPAQVLDGIPDSVTGGLPEVFDGRFVMVADQPGSDGANAPRPYPQASTTLGSHFAYAWEWRFFAVAALAIVPILARREVRDNAWIVDGVDLRDLDLTEEQKQDLGLVEKNPKKRKDGRTDEDVEDAILDQASAISSR